MKSIDRLVAEHEIIERGINVLEQIVARIDSDQPFPQEFPQWAPEFFSQFADKCHHAKEEDLFFPLLNQRGIVLALEPQIARCRRYNNTLSLVMMAVDAPVERDKLLIEISRLLKDQLRWADLIGCTDEQEFMLALPETPETAALQLTHKLKPLLGETSSTSLAGMSIWSCFGIAGWRKSDNAPSLLQRASTALAQARNTESNFLLISSKETSLPI